MTTERSQELAKRERESADEALSDAKHLTEESRLKAAANRAYYSMFHAAQAALAAFNLNVPKTHAGTINQFGEHLVNTGRVDRRLGRYITKASDLRLDSDYDAFATIEQPQVSEMVQNAEAFVAEVKRLLEERDRR